MPSRDTQIEPDSLVLRRRTALAGIAGACLTAGCSEIPQLTPSPSVSAPSFSHVGDPFPITVEGADGDAAVEVTARDRLDQPYRAQFDVSEGQTVAHPRMLFHALEFAGDSGTDPPLAYIPPKEPVEVDVALRRGGERLDSTTVTREYIDPAVESETLHENIHEKERYIGEFYVPPGDVRGPGVLTLHGSGAAPKRRMSKVLASRGYPTLALRYRGFERDSWGWVPIEYLTGAVDYLRDRPEVTDKQVGVVGHSMGGAAAFLTGIHSSAVGAVISYDGPPTHTGKYNLDAPDNPIPPWFTLDGEIHRTRNEVRAFWEALLREIETRSDVENCDYQSYKEAYAALDPEVQAKNTYRVEQIDGPVLIFSSGATPHVQYMPAPESLKDGFTQNNWMSRRVCVTASIRLRQYDHDYQHDLVSYNDAPHIIGRRPPYSLVNLPSYVETPAEPLVRTRASAWPHTLDYLARGIDLPSDEGTATATSA